MSGPSVTASTTLSPGGTTTNAGSATSCLSPPAVTRIDALSE
jgi:hypothetical protein